MPTFRSPALVLQTYDYSEADRIVVLFTRDYGKLRAVARGVRRTSSRLAGSLGLLSVAELQLYGHEHRELFLVTQAHLLCAFPRLKSDLENLGRGARIAELIIGLAPDHQPLPEAFALAIQALTLLEEGLPQATVGAWFDLAFLDRMGYRPRLDTCLTCGSDEGAMAYHSTAGGVVCRACQPSGGRSVSTVARRLLQKLLTCEPDWLRRLRAEPVVQEEIEELLDEALYFQLGRGLKTENFRRAVAMVK
jgi:DNA repair protein RecO (recombination protein O)